MFWAHVHKIIAIKIRNDGEIWDIVKNLTKPREARKEDGKKDILFVWVRYSIVIQLDYSENRLTRNITMNHVLWVE